MKFVWDDDKNKMNIRKHGISFLTASNVFYDEHRLELYDEKHSDQYEERYCTIGIADERYFVITVIYTMRSDMIRIISARISTKKEKEIYYDSL